MPECSEKRCHRTAYARGLCQTHHRQFLTEGVTRDIRPYRKRTAGTLKYSGLRLNPETVRKVSAMAKKRKLSHGAAVALILEDWATTASSRSIRLRDDKGVAQASA